MSRRYKYDVFISHAFEDQEEIGNLINVSLRDAGFRVWYSGTDLHSGNSIEQSLHKIIQECKYTVVIVSPHYLKSEWTVREFHVISSLESQERKIILPIWHKVSEKEITKKWPLLSDRFAISSEGGTLSMVTKLVREIKKRKTYQKRNSDHPSSKKRNQPDKNITHQNSGMTISGQTIHISATHVGGRDLKIFDKKK